MTAAGGGGAGPCWRWARCASPEAIAPLAEVLDDWQLDTRMAAVQGLGLTCLAEAASAHHRNADGRRAQGSARAPSTNALVRCFLDRPEALLPYLRRSQGESRELLARVASRNRHSRHGR